jgi:hypothetical protein
LWATFVNGKIYVLPNFDKNGLGHILGDFLTNSSGHPAHFVQSDVHTLIGHAYVQDLCMFYVCMSRQNVDGQIVTRQNVDFHIVAIKKLSSLTNVTYVCSLLGYRQTPAVVTYPLRGLTGWGLKCRLYFFDILKFHVHFGN